MSGSWPNGDYRENGHLEMPWALCLYVDGQSWSSENVVRTVNEVCEKHLPSRYNLKVIDVRESPQAVIMDQVMSLPMLVRQLPTPVRRIIGNLLDSRRLVVCLGIEGEKEKRCVS